jgi:hypothetical protein
MVADYFLYNGIVIFISCNIPAGTVAKQGFRINRIGDITAPLQNGNIPFVFRQHTVVEFKYKMVVLVLGLAL